LTNQIARPAQQARATRTRGGVIGDSRSPSELRVDARVQELTEMTIGRIDDPENPLDPVAPEAARLFGTGSRIPSVRVDGPTASNVRGVGR
jgi:hypothetical protein